MDYLNNILISIIVPVYNVEQYLAQCIESILKQTYKYLQIILVDDGSTDGSGIICDKYKEIDERIIVIHQQNKGLVGARKAGLYMATGQYIGFVDGDDYINKEMYQSLLDYAITENADVVHSAYFIDKWGVEREYIKYNKTIIESINEHEKFINSIFLSETGVAPSIWSKIFKSDLIKECYKDVDNLSSYGEDLICLISVCMKQCRIALIDKAFYHYRVRTESLSHKKNNNSTERDFILCDNIKRVLIKNGVFDKYKKNFWSFAKNQFIASIEKDCDNKFVIQRYSFPKPEILFNKRIVIFGAGRVGRDYYSQISRYNNCNIVAWIDSYYEKYNYDYIDVKAMETINNIEFDILVIAILFKEDADEIINALEDRGISTDNIIWEKPEKII